MTNVEKYKAMYRKMRTQPMSVLLDYEAMLPLVREWEAAYRVLTYLETEQVRDWLYNQKEESDNFWCAARDVEEGRIPTIESIERRKTSREREKAFIRIYTR